MEPDDLNKSDLIDIANNLPKYPPLKPGGELTIRDLYPDLTEEELDYVFENYKGTMSRDKEI